MSAIDSKGQITSAAWFSRALGYEYSLLANFTCSTRVRVKNLMKPDILKIQNKHFYSPYSNETFYIKALEYKEYFTHINLWRILKSLDAFRRYSTFSPYENTECLAKRWVNIRLFRFVYLFWRHWTPRWKGYFVRISMVFFFKGGWIHAEIFTL
jgi:hypothetical protein